MRAVLRGAVAAGLLWLVLAALALPASAHARLVSTDPAGGATLEEPPARVTLTFSEPIETSFSGVQVFGPDRERVDSGDARVDSEKVFVPLQDDLGGGRYTVVFRIISADGHPVRSQFRFTVAPQQQPATEPPPASEPPTEAASPAPTDAPSEDASEPAGAPNEPDDEVFELEDAGSGTATGLWISRFASYLLLTVTIGLLVTATYLLPRAEWTPLQRKLTRSAAWAAVGWTISLVALFVFSLSSLAARALPGVLTPDLLARFVQTRLGSTLGMQTIIVLVVAVVAAVARRRPLAVTALALAALAAVGVAWSGHAGTDELPVVALASSWVHLISVASWVGGLVVLAGIVVFARDTDVPAAANRFSRLAGVAIGVVLVTGGVNAMLHLGSLENLWDTTWGRLVVGKVIAIAVIGWFGWRNRNRMLPRLAAGGDNAAGAFRTMALGEVAVMAVAFALATSLASSIPADAEAASRIQSVASTFGQGQVNVTVDPAEVGSNVVHVYFLTASGTQQEVTDPELTFTAPGLKRRPGWPSGTLDAELFKAGPGHYTVLAQDFPEAGEYEMALSATVEGQPETLTATVVVR